MGRLIEADNFKRYIIETYHDPIIVCNDDEVHFVAEIIDDYPTIEAIPKADYENRLKADLVAMLEELKSKMDSIKECEQQIYGKESWNFVGKCQDMIQSKIDKLKENKDGME